jgi:hypothetical protein
MVGIDKTKEKSRKMGGGEMEKDQMENENYKK